MHLGDEVYNITVIYGSRDVEEYHFRIVPRLYKILRHFHRIARRGHKNLIRLDFVGKIELVHDAFETGILVCHQQVMFPIDIHRVLCVVAVYDRDFHPFDVAEITRHKSGQGGLARATLLGSEGDIDCVAHNWMGLNCELI